MTENSKIQWTHHTMNPWIGCVKVSPGCANCYAEVNRFVTIQRSKGRELWGADGERHVVSDAKWREPLTWNKRAAATGVRERVFCASLADVFEDRRDLDAPRARLWKLIDATQHLDWLLLTKRPDVAVNLWPWGADVAPRNVWLGCTAEDQKRADERVPHLLKVPARVRFLSCEPLLGPVDLDEKRDWLTPVVTKPRDAARIGWVIVGGESGGREARAMPLHWAREIVWQCSQADVACFVKQLGSVWARDKAASWPPADTMFEGIHHKGGEIEQWPLDLQVREFPEVRR